VNDIRESSVIVEEESRSGLESFNREKFHTPPTRHSSTTVLCDSLPQFGLNTTPCSRKISPPQYLVDGGNLPRPRCSGGAERYNTQDDVIDERR
jgi:hypothetical protein